MTNSTVPNDQHQFFEDAPVLFLQDLCADSREQAAPESIKQDWEIVSKWLGEDGSRFTEANKTKIRQAWKAYVAIGIAPSISLQRIFDGFSAKLSIDEPLPRPPQDILNVFDRLLATDDEIAKKRRLDIATEMSKLEAIFAPKSRKSWWRSRTLLFRNWAFGTII